MKPVEYSCKVTSFRMLTPTVFETCFETGSPLTFKAGQFVSVVIPGAGPKGRDLRRAYSVASSPENRPIELCIKIVDEGPGSQYLYRLREGDSFRVVAPYGDFTFEPRRDRTAFFIATGTGIAPFRSMVFSEQFKENLPKEAHCLLGVRTEDELLYVKEFQDLPEVNFIPIVSQPMGTWSGFRGRVTDYIKNLKSDFQWLETEYYLCGNGAMINEVKAFLLEKGVLKDSIHQEKYY